MCREKLFRIMILTTYIKVIKNDEESSFLDDSILPYSITFQYICATFMIKIIYFCLSLWKRQMNIYFFRKRKKLLYMDLL